jgi:hypothetical protein
VNNFLTFRALRGTYETSRIRGVSFLNAKSIEQGAVRNSNAPTMSVIPLPEGGDRHGKVATSPPSSIEYPDEMDGFSLAQCSLRLPTL